MMYRIERPKSHHHAELHLDADDARHVRSAGDVDGHRPVALVSNPFSFTNHSVSCYEEYLQSVQ